VQRQGGLVERAEDVPSAEGVQRGRVGDRTDILCNRVAPREGGVDADLDGLGRLPGDAAVEAEPPAAVVAPVAAGADAEGPGHPVVAAEGAVPGEAAQVAGEGTAAGEAVAPGGEAAVDAEVEAVVAEELAAAGESQLGRDEIPPVVPGRTRLDADVPAAEEGSRPGAVVSQAGVQVEAVGIRLEADVVDLEGGADRSKDRFPPPRAGLLGDLHLRGIASEVGGRGIDPDMAGVGALEVARGAALRPHERLGLARYIAGSELSGERPGPAGELVPEIDAAGERASMEVGGESPPSIEGAVDGGRDHAEAGPPLVQVAAGTEREIVGPRLHRLLAGYAAVIDESRRLQLRHSIQRSERPAALRLPRHLRRADDRRRVRHVRVNRLRGQITLRTPADPARVQEVRVHSATLAEAEDLISFGEEGALLVEARLEGGEVQVGGVHLDLAEVRVHRRVQRDVGAEPVLQVEPQVAAEVPAVVIGVREVHRFIEGHVPELGTGGGEGDQLQAARPLDVRDSLEVTEA